MKRAKHRSDCPTNFTLEILGDSCSLLIIRDLAFKGKSYYGDFLDSDEKISTNILANRLNMLEAERIIKKTQDPNKKSKIIYRLTNKGLDLLPTLIEDTLWGAKYYPKHNAPKKFIIRARDNRVEFIKEIRTKLKGKI